MIQALVTYPIVALAAAWVLWSMILPARTRVGLRRMVGLGTLACAALGPPRACGACDGSGCPLVTPRRASARAAPRASVPRNSA